MRDQLMRNHVRLLSGSARFLAPDTLAIASEGVPEVRVSADKIILAVGTRPARPDSVEFDGRTVVDSDGVLNLTAIPASMVVVGAGVIGIEYASMFAALGTQVTVVEQRDCMLEFCDSEIVEALQYHLRDLPARGRGAPSSGGMTLAPIVTPPVPRARTRPDRRTPGRPAWA